MSRKTRALRVFLHQNKNPTIKEAWDAAWKRAQKVFHARSMQNLEEKLASTQAELEKLKSYYGNGIDCFANPCKEHSGEKTPPFDEFFEKYGGKCVICLVNQNQELRAKLAALKAGDV
ncbi:hypothetical protein ZC03_072 [Pseudomonas phage ZC03]|uniref:Uncharacterized protein n=2 Tax=Zicotriavirus TaxID=2843161 RepID=A0A1L2C969_9CAUD|nr:hypothetical protein HWA93_gp57 [Pseudomonas phage ZC03]YP_009830629.1 hypothetical protein HWA94_gp59 [Pseudomonas phage ZC08]AMD43449.1 hypothetical protein ZC03_072 [Pseudomonas phage ZC03]AMD43498.1 hypothetical protein ZC08_067 [Pseudomonas phage ZC08]